MTIKTLPNMVQYVIAMSINSKTKSKIKKGIAITLMVLAIGAISFASYQLFLKPKPSPSSLTPAKTVDPVSPAAQVSGSSAQTLAPPSTIDIPLPVLAKSSGNNGPVPIGATINFTCSSTLGYSCAVELQRQGITSVFLEKQQLAGENGQYAANWYWQSTSGSWSVTAILSNSSGQSKSSAAHTVEIK